MSTVELGDVPQQREAFFGAAIDGISSHFPLSNQQVELRLDDIKYGSEQFTKKDERHAILNDKTLGRNLWGNLSLVDRSTGEVLDKRRRILAKVPYLTPRGTFIYRGNDYTVSNQLRLKPGVYTRIAASGNIEAPIQVRQGGGMVVSMDPSSGELRLSIHQSKLKLYSLLRALGVDDEAIKESWGEDLYQTNKTKEDPRAISRIMHKLLGKSEGDPRTKLLAYFAEREISPELTERAIGVPANRVGPDVFLAAGRRLADISRGEKSLSSRDALYAQKVMTAAHQLKFLLGRRTKTVNRLLWNVTNKKNLDPVPVGAFNEGIKYLLFRTGLAQASEEANPLESFDLGNRITRTGAFGLTGRGVPFEARFVQPSHAGFIDAVRASESENVGLDVRGASALGMKIDDKGNLITKMINARTGAEESVKTSQLKDLVVSFPDQLQNPEPLAVIAGTKHARVPREEVDYFIRHPLAMFSPLTALSPMLSGAGHLRAFMGGKFVSQALPLTGREEPLVQSEYPDPANPTVEALLAPKLGAERAPVSGVVLRATSKGIVIRGPGEKDHKIELYESLPLNRMTELSQTPTVKAGDTVSRGQTIATSNFTSEGGRAALGVNLRVGFVPASSTYEDAMAVSESAAGRLTSTHLYARELQDSEEITSGKKNYVSIFPGKFTVEQLNNIGEDGLVKPGTVVQPEDPIILAYSSPKKQPYFYQISRRRSLNRDEAVVWDKPTPGVVTDAVRTKDGHRVFVKTDAPMVQGDKLGLRHGSKGIITVIPDEEMPRDKEGKPLDLLISPLSVISRQNPAMVAEALLGKIAKQRGEPYVVPAFMAEGIMSFVKKELDGSKTSATEPIYNPSTGNTMGDVMTGYLYAYKLSHTAKGKARGRSLESYTAEEVPTKGGLTGGKKIGIQSMNALLSHGSLGIIADSQLITGAKNEEFWNALRLGYSLPIPKVPYVNRKVFDLLQGAGINIARVGDQLHIMPLRDKDIEKASRGAINTSDMLDLKTLRPVKGGLFDPEVTGGPGSQHWGHYDLPVPIPNPIMEKVVANLLHIPEKRVKEIVAGKEEIEGGTGGHAIHKALSSINVGSRVKYLESSLSQIPASRRDKAVKELKYLRMLKENKIAPEELVLSKIPILPTAARPISQVIGVKGPVVTDVNYLYKDLIDLSAAYDKALGVLPKSHIQEEEGKIYAAVKAVFGVGDPISRASQDKKLKGIFGSVFGSSPKYSFVKHQILSRSQDISGLAVVTPNARMDMDHVGLPIDQAWEIYRPFVIRRLVLDGVRPDTAIEYVKDKHPRAKMALEFVVQERPVILNRAPTLHKFGMQAFWPILVKGATLQMSPTVTHGFGMDFDGDTTMFYVPVSAQAVKDAQNMLPSKNLYNPRMRDPEFLPIREFGHGLYLASRLGKGSPKTFRTKADAVIAYRKGQIKADQPVVIIGRLA
jgi:DNA-directed RNA polymerase beta subunit